MHVTEILIYDNVASAPISPPSASFFASPVSLRGSNVSDVYLSPASSPNTVQGDSEWREEEGGTGLHHLYVLSNQSSPNASQAEGVGGGVTAESGYSSHSLLSPLPAQMSQTLPLSDRPQLSGCSPHPDPNSRPALLPHTPGEAIQRGSHTARFPLGPCWEEGCRGRTASYCPYFPLSPWLHLSPPALHTECAATGQERRTKVTGEPGTAPTPTHTANWAPHRGIVTPLV